MLAPVTEADFGEEGPLRVNLLARERWPGVRRGARGGHRPADRLPRQRRARGGGRSRRRRGAPAPARASSARSGSRPSGSRRRAAARSSRGSRRASPAASWRRRTASADPRATVRALAAAVEELELGVEVEAIEHDGAAVTGVRTSGGDDRVRARWWWPPARGAPRSRRSATGPPVRPVKGQILELRARGAMPSPFERVAAHAALLPRRARRRARGARRDGRGAGLRHGRHGRRRLPAARGGLGGAARGGRAGAGRARAPACGRARPTTRRWSARASSTG